MMISAFFLEDDFFSIDGLKFVLTETTSINAYEHIFPSINSTIFEIKQKL